MEAKTPPGDKKVRRASAWPVILIVFMAASAMVVFGIVIVESLTPGDAPAGASSADVTATAKAATAKAVTAGADESADAASAAAGATVAAETAEAETLADETSAHASAAPGVVTAERLPVAAAPASGGICTGTVVDLDGSAAAGAIVTFIPLREMEGYGQTEPSVARTASNGAFHAALPFPGEYRIKAVKGRGIAWHESASPGANVHLRLEPTAVVKVTVEDLDAAQPAAFRLAMNYPAAGLEIPGKRTGNTVVFAETPPGAYVFSVRAGGSFAELPVESCAGVAVDAAIALPPPVALEGVVKDSFGLPVPEAVVSARSAATGNFVDRAETDGQGRFLLAAPEGRYGLEVEAAGYVPAAVPLGKTGVLQEVAVTPGVLWTGKVAGRDGETIADARVIVEYAIPPMPGTRQRQLEVSTDGTFEWRSSGAMSERFSVVATGYAPRCFTRVVPALAPRGREEPRLPVFMLFPEELALGGMVQDEAGEPLAGVRVTLVSDAVAAGSPYYGEAADVTDEAGLFELPDGAFGSYRVYADGGGFARLCESLFLTQDEMLVLPLRAGREVAGYVTGSEGLPLADAEVRLEHAGRPFAVRTNRKGRFVFSGVPAVPLPVAARGAEPVTAAGEEAIEFHLEQGGVLAGTAVDGTGRTIRYFKAAVILPGEDVNGSKPRWYAADGSGRFAITVPARPARILFRRPGCEDVLVPGVDLVAGGQSYSIRGGIPIVFHWAGVGHREGREFNAKDTPVLGD